MARLILLQVTLLTSKSGVFSPTLDEAENKTATSWVGRGGAVGPGRQGEQAQPSGAQAVWLGGWVVRQQGFSVQGAAGQLSGTCFPLSFPLLKGVISDSIMAG